MYIYICMCIYIYVRIYIYIYKLYIYIYSCIYEQSEEDPAYWSDWDFESDGKLQLVCAHEFRWFRFGVRENVGGVPVNVPHNFTGEHKHGREICVLDPENWSNYLL